MLRAALALRALLLAAGVAVDEAGGLLQLRYTDIDYSVFSDAADLVRAGRSPYERATYRYTPLLAYALVPNSATPARIWGKLLFVAADLLAGLLIASILAQSAASKTAKSRYAAAWLLNPFVAVISTRGNAESVVACLVLLALWFHQRGSLRLAALWFGVAVHFKIYPVIYALPLVLNILAREKSSWRELNWRRAFTFAAISAGTFFALGLLFYILEGNEFLNNTYLYHVTRKDHRHNFSVYFYALYMFDSKLLGIATFLPQLVAVIAAGVLHYRNVPLACFLQTWSFVMLNKVVTSQYFLWYICLLPLVLPYLNISQNKRRLVAMAGAWIGAQALWLHFAYRLEHLGENTFRALFLSSCVLLLVNAWIGGEIARLCQGTGSVVASQKRAKRKGNVESQ